jgi:ubiquinone/menaquinone biosynthesis C-methylase UbiE
MTMNHFERHKKAQIDLAEKYDEQIAINLPLAWNWDNRYISSLPYLFAFSTAVTALDGAVGDLVLDFACGSGWISEWLNRLGFRTVAVDISPTLLSFVKKRLACDTRIDLERFPVELVECDADRLPFKDETFDGIVCMNSLHHFADYQIILEEMFRVLKEGGRASFSEPGRCHSQEPASKLEMQTTGVLERDVVLSEIHTMAKRAGFGEMTITPLMPPHTVNYDYSEWQRFLKGRWRVTRKYLKKVRNSIECSNAFFCLHKAGNRKDSRRPGILKAKMEKVEMPGKVSSSSPLTITVHVKNTGDTLWLSKPTVSGFVRLGIKLRGNFGEEKEYWRASLPKDVAPGEAVVISTTLEAPPLKGRYRFKLDLVCEGRTWFEHVGNTPPLREVVVE